MAMMKLMSEDQILDGEFRKTVIAEILGPENVARKNEALRRYECFKDQTKKWVMKSFELDGLEEKTIAQLMSRASNISIVKKIVNKLARTYSGGVIRTGATEEATKAIDEMARYLGFDDKQRKSDRYRELFRNTVTQIVQQLVGGTEDEPIYGIGQKVLGPWEYDVIEDCFNREIPRVFILSDYIIGAPQPSIDSSPPATTDNRDAVIADAPRDQDKGKRQTFIWWSENYHFTTWEDGTYCEEMIETKIDEETGEPAGMDLSNPIEMLPFVNNAEEQDGAFWAEGGEDIVDGAILVNKQITDMFYVMMMQGYGVPVISGKNLKGRYNFGPGNAILLEYDPEKEDPKPEVTFASANPPIDAWMRSIEQILALLLTTNNLSVTQIAGKLDATQLPSGIAMIIEMAEVTLETEDKFGQYAKMERSEFEITQKWQAYLVPTENCDPKLKALPLLPPDVGTSMTTKFITPKPVMSEGEKLDNLTKRKNLGINTDVDLIMIDNPDMTREEAETKLEEINAQKADKAAAFGTPPAKGDAGAADQGGKQNDQQPPTDNKSADAGAGDNQPPNGDANAS